MFFGGDIAQHCRSKPSDHGCTNGTCDVIIAWGNICSEGAKGIKWSLVTDFELFVHIFFDEVHWNMSRAFYHDLYIVFPCDFGELSECFQFTELCFIVGVSNATWTKTIPERKGNIIGLHNRAYVFKMCVKKVFFVVCQTPFGDNGTSSRNDSS